MLLKSAAFGALLLLQFWIPVGYSAASYQDLQYREYIDELLGRHDPAPFEHTPRGLEAQRAALLAFRKSIEDELEVLLARTEEDEPPPPPYDELPEPLPGYQFLTIKFWAPCLEGNVLVGIMRAEPAFTLRDFQEFVAKNVVGKDPNGNPALIPAEELSFERLDLKKKKRGIEKWISVQDGVVPNWKNQKNFRVTWHRKSSGISPQSCQFFEYTLGEGPNNPAAVPGVKGGSRPVELGTSSQNKLDGGR